MGGFLHHLKHVLLFTGVAMWGVFRNSPVLPCGSRLSQESPVRPFQLPSEHGPRCRGLDGLVQETLLQSKPPGTEGKVPSQALWCFGRWKSSHFYCHDHLVVVCQKSASHFCFWPCELSPGKVQFLKSLTPEVEIMGRGECLSASLKFLHSFVFVLCLVFFGKLKSWQR